MSDYDNLRRLHEQQRTRVLRALDKAHSDELSLNQMLDDTVAERNRLREQLAATTARAEAAEAERDNLAAVIANLPKEAIALAQHIWQQETQS